MSLEMYLLNGHWRVEIDPDDPVSTFMVHRDGYFRVKFNPDKWGQPVLYEVEKDGYAGMVIPIIKKEDGIWYVLATRNDRPANDYKEKLLEGARTSASNQNPFLSPADLPITYFDAPLYSNSARINGAIRTGIADATGKDFTPPANAEWVSWDSFAETTDSMTMAVLFRYMIHSDLR